MTATPIPRTLALTDYSELDVSKITDLPPGRKPVRTLVKPESRRDEVFDLIRQELDQGRQAYIIYPLVEESEKVDLRSATEMADHLQAEVFPAYRVALLHGRMKQEAKDSRHAVVHCRPHRRCSSRRRSSRSASTCRTHRSWWSSTPSGSACRSSTSCADEWVAARGSRIACCCIRRRGPTMPGSA